MHPHKTTYRYYIFRVQPLWEIQILQLKNFCPYSVMVLFSLGYQMLHFKLAVFNIFTYLPV